MRKPYWLRWLRWHTSKKRRASKSRRAEWQMECIARRLRRSDIAVDCGANVGEFTALMARRGARVIAFEPDPLAYEALEKRFANAPNVQLRKQAVGSFAGQVRLYRAVTPEDLSLSLTESSSVYKQKTNVNPNSFVEVDQIDFAEFIRSLDGPVQLLKMDIEGAEFDLLSKLIVEDLIGRVRNIFVETHDHKIPGLQEIGAQVRSQIAALKRDDINLDWH